MIREQLEKSMNLVVRNDGSDRIVPKKCENNQLLMDNEMPEQNLFSNKQMIEGGGKPQMNKSNHSEEDNEFFDAEEEPEEQVKSGQLSDILVMQANKKFKSSFIRENKISD